MSLLPSLLCESRPALHCILDAAGALYATTLFFGIINSIVVQPVVAEERAVSYRWAQCLAGPACSSSTRKPSRQQEGNICVCPAPCPGLKLAALAAASGRASHCKPGPQWPVSPTCPLLLHCWTWPLGQAAFQLCSIMHPWLDLVS